MLSRPLTTHQAALLLGARPLWVPPRALAPDPPSYPSSTKQQAQQQPTVDERPGWLNALLEQLWPALDSAAAGAVATAVQPLLDASRPPFVRALGFEQLTLGALPLRLDRLRLIDPASPPVGSGGDGDCGIGGVAVEADVAWAGHANVSFFVELATPVGGGQGAGAGGEQGAFGGGALRLSPRVEDIGLRGTLRLALSPAHAAPSGSPAAPQGPLPPPPFAAAPPPLPAALVVSFSRPPTVKFALRFARALALPSVVGAVVERPVQAFLDEALREAVCGLLVWPQRIVLPLAPLLRLLLPSAGGAGGAAAATPPDDEAPPDGLLDDEDAALDAMHLRSVGLLRVEALGVRRGGSAVAGEGGGAGTDLPGTVLGQRLELEVWTEPSSRARLTVPTAANMGTTAMATATATAVPPPPVATAMAAAAGPSATTATSGAALPSAAATGGGDDAASSTAAAAAELLVQEPRSQRARLTLRVADALAAPRALLHGQLGESVAALFGSAEQRRVGRASLALADIASAHEGGGGAASRVTEGWFALSPADEDWEDIEQSFYEQKEGGWADEREQEEEEDDDEGASTVTTTTTTKAAAIPAAASAAAAAAAAAAASASSSPLQLRLRLTYLPLLPPAPGSPVPTRGGVLRVAVRRARRLPPLPHNAAAAAHFAVVDVGPPSSSSSPSSSSAPAGPPSPSSRRRQTPPMPPSPAPAWRCRFEFGGCSLADAVRVAVFARELGGWGAAVPMGEAVVSLGALLGLMGSEGSAGSAAGSAGWPLGEWIERRVGAAEGWADLVVGDGEQKKGGGGGGQVLLRLEYTSAGEAAAALAAGTAA